MSEGLGWLPVEAREDLEQQEGKASAEEAARLIALPPRARVIALMERAACRSAADSPCPALRPADALRVIRSFDGEDALEEGSLAERFPGLVATTA
jgi:hypothetical protein